MYFIPVIYDLYGTQGHPKSFYCKFCEGFWGASVKEVNTHFRTIHHEESYNTSKAIGYTQVPTYPIPFFLKH